MNNFKVSWITFVAGFFFAFTSFTHSAYAGPKPDILSLKSHNIKIFTHPVTFKRGDENQKLFGKLIWRGGYKITSSSPFWGGLSGAAIANDGKKMVMVSDAGTWALVPLNYKKNRLLPLKTAKIGPLLALKGRALKRGRDRDAEAITLVKSDKLFGKAYISFEQNHRVGVFSVTKNGLSAPKRYLRLRKITRKLRGNAGLEALTILRGGQLKGSLVAIAQSKQDKHGNFKGWLVRGGKIVEIKFVPPPLDRYRITDAVSLDNGDLLLLERRYKFLTINIRIRHVRQSELLSKRPIKGTILMEANSNEHMIDNMEVITAHKNKHGETILTLLSDDNFNSFQKNLILQFALPKKSLVAGASRQK